jgi:hypothetical protein
LWREEIGSAIDAAKAMGAGALNVLDASGHKNWRSAKKTGEVCSAEFWHLQKSDASRSRAPFISSKRSDGMYGVVAAPHTS